MPDRPVRRVVLEDPSLPHQIILRLAPHSHLLAVSCNCLRGSGEVIEVREHWTATEAIAVWRAHVAEAEAA